jgi:hypothetical protein
MTADRARTHVVATPQPAGDPPLEAGDRALAEQLVELRLDPEVGPEGASVDLRRFDLVVLPKMRARGVGGERIGISERHWKAPHRMVEPPKLTASAAYASKFRQRLVRAKIVCPNFCYREKRHARRPVIIQNRQPETQIRRAPLRHPGAVAEFFGYFSEELSNNTPPPVSSPQVFGTIASRRLPRP